MNPDWMALSHRLERTKTLEIHASPIHAYNRDNDSDSNMSQLLSLTLQSLWRHYQMRLVCDFEQQTLTVGSGTAGISILCFPDLLLRVESN